MRSSGRKNVLLCLLPLLWIVDAQLAARDATIPAHDIYGKMLAYAQNAEYDKVLRSADYMATRIVAIEKAFDVQIREQMTTNADGRNQEALLQGIRWLVYLDIRLLNRECMQLLPSTDKALVKLRLAVLDYSVLSLSLATTNPRADAEIKECWRRGYELVERTSPYLLASDPFEYKELAAVFQDLESRIKAELGVDK